MALTASSRSITDFAADHPTTPELSRTPADAPVLCVLLTVDPIQQELLAPFGGRPGLKVVHVGALSPRWIALAHLADGIIVASDTDPLAGIVYAASAAIDRPIVIAAPAHLVTCKAELQAAGAFRCVGLPARIAEIDAMARALWWLRPANAEGQFLDFVLEPVRREVLFGKRSVRLGRQEFTILDALVRHAGKPIAAVTLMQCLAEGDVGRCPSRRTLDVHVCRLRRKLETVGLPTVISTIRAFGYRLESANRSRV